MIIQNNTEIVSQIRRKFLVFDAEGKIEINASDWNGKNVIYMIVNLLTNKKYIGKTTNLLNRANNYILNYRKEQTGDHRPLISDIRKYGIENFRMFPLAIVKSRRALAEAEKFYAEQYDTYAPKGYNVGTISSTLNHLYKHDSGHPHTAATKAMKSKLVACVNPDTKQVFISVGMKLFGDLIGKGKDIVKNSATGATRLCGFYIIYLSENDRNNIKFKVENRVKKSINNSTRRGLSRSNHNNYFAVVSDVETMLLEENAEVFESNGYQCYFLSYNEDSTEENAPSYIIQPISEFFKLPPNKEVEE